jgi:hypothetical protein
LGYTSGTFAHEEYTTARTTARTGRTKRLPAAPENVEAFIASLHHPFEQEILAIRKTILTADPSIEEGIKWKAPSFRTKEYFATMHLRVKDGVGVILHLGAKKRTLPRGSLVIADPESLLEWLAKDRAVATFGDLRDISARQSAFADIVRQWIRHL